MKFELEVVKFDVNDVVTSSPANCGMPWECGCFNPNPNVVANV